MHTVPGEAEEDSRFREGDRHFRLAYDDDEEEALVGLPKCHDAIFS